MDIRFPFVEYDPDEPRLIINAVDLDNQTPDGDITIDFEPRYIVWRTRNDVVYEHEYKDLADRVQWELGGLLGDFRQCLHMHFGSDDDSQQIIQAASNPLWDIVRVLSTCSILFHQFQANNHLIRLSEARQLLEEALLKAERIGTHIRELGEAFPDTNYLQRDAERQQLSTIGRLDSQIQQAITNIEHRHQERLAQSTSPLKNQIKRAETEISERLERVRKDAESIENRIQTVIDGATNRFDKTHSNYDILLSETKRSVSAEIKELEHIIDGEEKAYRSRLEKFTDLDQEANAKLEEAEAKRVEIITLLETTKEKFEALTQLKAEEALTNEFKKAASGAKWSAAGWTLAFFAVGVLTVLVFGVFIFDVQGISLGAGVTISTPQAKEGIDWSRILIRISITAVLAYILVYAGNQAGQQRNYQKYFSRLSMELAALDAYIVPYSDEEKLNIKMQFMTAYFGRVDAPRHEKGTAQPSLDFLNLAKNLAEIRQKKKDEEEEETEKKQPPKDDKPS